jgi:predicted protein tyrosine phosphatase
MSEVQVFGEQELIDHIVGGGTHYDYLISIGNPRRIISRKNPGQTMPRIFKETFKEILRLEFFDVERKDQLGPMRPRKIAKLSDVKRAINFYNRTRMKTAGYTLHCWRGVSRSPAFALGYIYLSTESEKLAKEYLQRIRPEAIPLQLIITYFDRLLGSNLSYVNDEIRRERIEAWKKELALEEDMLLEELPTIEDTQH